MSYQAAVLFDLDGTLVDTLTDLANATNAVLEKHGLPTHPTEAFRRFVGNGAMMQIKRAMGVHDAPPLTETVYNDYLAEYERRCLETVQPYEGIPELLEALKARGIAVGIVTNKPQTMAVRIADHLFGEHYFCAVCGATETAQKKPDPTVALQVLSTLGVPTERAIFVGDSDVDVYTAKNLGCHGIGVAWGFRGVDELIAANTEYLAETAQDVLAIAERLLK